MSPIDFYVQDVLSHLSVSASDRKRIEADLRAHLNESIAAGLTPDEAIERMGPPSEVAAELMSSLTPAYAPVSSRIGAGIMDLVIVIGIPIIVFLLYMSGLAGGLSEDPAAVNFTFPVMFMPFFFFGFSLLPLLYFVVFESATGTTPGKRLFGLNVAMLDGKPLKFATALVRRLPILFGPAFLLDAAVMLVSDKRQRGMEMLAKTVVLETEEKRSVIAWLVLAVACLSVLFLVYFLVRQIFMQAEPF